MPESDTRREAGSEDARTLDPALQQYITSAQPDPERQTDARLGEQTPRDRRIQKDSEKGRMASNGLQGIKDGKPRIVIIPQDATSNSSPRARPRETAISEKFSELHSPEQG